MVSLVRAVRTPESPALDERLCGLSLLLRAVLVAQGKGADRVAVLVREDDLELARRLVDDPRLVRAPEVVADPAELAGETPDLELAHDRVADVLLRTEADRREAKRRLFEACRKPVDGLVSRHLNRHVSIAISKALVDTPVTPNGMTIFTFSLSLAAAAFAVRGGYLPTLAAAFLMQWNSILDGCDGELARVRHQGSKLGQWLDTVGDDLSNVIFWAALGVGARGLPGLGGMLPLCGYLGAAGNLVAALANYAVLSRLGSGDFYALDAGEPKVRSGLVGGAVALVELVLKQDFFLFLMLIVAAVGWMHHALMPIAVGAVVTAVNSLVRAAKFFASRPR